MTEELIERSNNLTSKLLKISEVIDKSVRKVYFWMDQWALVLCYIKKPNGSTKEMPNITSRFKFIEKKGLIDKYTKCKNKHPSELVSSDEYSVEIYDTVVGRIDNQFDEIVKESTIFGLTLTRIVNEVDAIGLDIFRNEDNIKSSNRLIRKEAERTLRQLLKQKISLIGDYLLVIDEFTVKVNTLTKDKCWDEDLFSAVYTDELSIFKS